MFFKRIITTVLVVVAAAVAAPAAFAMPDRAPVPWPPDRVPVGPRAGVRTCDRPRRRRPAGR